MVLLGGCCHCGKTGFVHDDGYGGILLGGVETMKKPRAPRVPRAPKTHRACDIAALTHIPSRGKQDSYISACRSKKSDNPLKGLSLEQILALSELKSYKKVPRKPSTLKRKSSTVGRKPRLY